MSHDSTARPIFHLLHLSSLSTYEQLQLEEALLRADEHNWCLLNHGSHPALIMGISGQPHQLLHQDLFKQKPLPLIRRFSGGGTVVVDEQTCFISFICQTNTLPVLPFPEKIMRWTEEIYRPIFGPLPFSLQENDYVIGHHKCGGNAQSITKQRWLHHSSFLWDYCPQKMSYLTMPPKTPAYRKHRTHEDFLCRLKEYWSTPEEFLQAIKQELYKHFHVIEKTYEEVIEVKQKPHRQALQWINLYS